MRHPWRLIPALLAALTMAAGAVTATPNAAAAWTCGNASIYSGSYYQSWDNDDSDGPYTISDIEMLTYVSNGHCFRSYILREKGWASTGGSDFPYENIYKTHNNLRVWVCGSPKSFSGDPSDQYNVQSSYEQSPYYDYGSSTNPCGPQADNYSSSYYDPDWSNPGPYNQYVSF